MKPVAKTNLASDLRKRNLPRRASKTDCLKWTKPPSRATIDRIAATKTPENKSAENQQWASCGTHSFPHLSVLIFFGGGGGGVGGGGMWRVLFCVPFLFPLFRLDVPMVKPMTIELISFWNQSLINWICTYIKAVAPERQTTVMRKLSCLRCAQVFRPKNKQKRVLFPIASPKKESSCP